MAKTDINRHTGKFSPPIDRFRRYMLQENFDRMDREANETRPKKYQLGPKSIAINAYLEGGRKKAYSVIQSSFKRSNGEPAYSREIIDEWVDEYEKNRKRARDDDDAR